MSCDPTYEYTPTERPEPANSVAPTYEEHRSRLFAGGTFFRSVDLGSVSLNNILLQIKNSNTLQVWISGMLVEQFVPAANTIGALRTAVNASSNLITMPTRGTDFYDLGAIDDSALPTINFGFAYMSGATGIPSPITQPFLDSIFTGPQRTMIIISQTEDANGYPAVPGSARRVLQYNGTEFVSYNNNVQGSCPVDG